MALITIDGATPVTFECDESDTIMRAALRHGLGFPYSCNVGACGNCRFQLLDGEVEHLQESPRAWTERDEKRQRYLGCQARPLSDCRIKLRTNEQYVPQTEPVKVSATFKEKTVLTHDLSEFALELDKPLPFLAGQYALLGASAVDGPRAYSMCNVSRNDTEWSFQIKRVPDGAMTTHLFDLLQPGDALTLDGPFGTAYLREDSERDILCLAGGSGLSPMIAIARAAAEHPQLRQRRLDFIFGGRRPEDMCGEELLRDLPGFGSTLHFHSAISEDISETEWSGLRGFVHDVAQQLFGEALQSKEIYFAGPPLMAQAVQKMLFDLKVPLDQVHFDEFY
ncbi:2Fe-2S iron-sulfur cluster-binding protein [Saccharospirillum sp.]|uniref:2Fe-2S iron-sulfur cluster-binding protein n=1 Tax=Saccharospirillum sp. TaxID=2033801 RepID=UPI00349FE5A2